MANQAAFESGYQQGYNALEQRRAHKQALSDEDLQGKISELVDNRKAIQAKLPTLLDEQGNPTPQYDDAIQSLTQNAQALREIYHPNTNPNAISRFGHLLTDALHITKPEDRIQKEGAKRAALAQQDEREALGVAAAAPVSPAQQATEQRNAQLQASIDSINKSDLSPEDKAEAKRKMFGVSEKPTLRLYVSPDGGTKAWLDASRPDSIPVGWTAYTAPSAEVNKRADFDAFKKEHPDYKGTFESWTAGQAAAGRSAAPKPETLDTQYKAILVKKASGKPLTPDEVAHEAAWQIYNRETKIDPGVARAAAFGSMRYIMVVDPKNPENVIPMRAGDAAKAGVNTPASISFKTDQAITRYMTSGAGGTNINYFNTATDHLRLLKEAGEALNNGNVQVFNEYANRFATATGDPAPTNFETVKAAVAGELSKTFKGTGATDSEIADINQTINQAQSPDQIHGAIDYYTNLMGSKVHALQLQYEAGRQGKPNFGNATPTPPAGADNNSNPSSGQYVYAKDKDGKLHRAKVGTPLPPGWVLTNAPTK